MDIVKNDRTSAYDIESVFLERWSPRSFDEKEIPEEILHSVFEAARWAPSAGNAQPWRFIIAKNKEDRSRFLQLINEGNVSWCKDAPVLVAIVSKYEEQRFGGFNKSHAFDTGAAWGYLALEAARKGLITHAMGGFNHEKAEVVLQIPNGYDIHAIIAIGYQGSKDKLSESLQEREKPSNRRPLESFLSEGVFEE